MRTNYSAAVEPGTRMKISTEHVLLLMAHPWVPVTSSDKQCALHGRGDEQGGGEANRSPPSHWDTTRPRSRHPGSHRAKLWALCLAASWNGQWSWSQTGEDKGPGLGPLGTAPPNIFSDNGTRGCVNCSSLKHRKYSSYGTREGGSTWVGYLYMYGTTQRNTSICPMKNKITSFGGKLQNLETLYAVGGNVKRLPLWKVVWRLPIKWNPEWPRDLAIPLLGICPKWQNTLLLFLFEILCYFSIKINHSFIFGITKLLLKCNFDKVPAVFFWIS